jgi:DNA-nicking Smr family endonuclease
MVREFIECDKRLGASGHPDARLGGSGATWVAIKRSLETPSST